MKLARRFIASTLMVSCTLMGLPMSAQAAIVPTDALVTTQEAQFAEANRARVNTFFARDDVQLAMVQQGVEEGAAAARVNAMSDAEIAQLAGKIDTAPAGGEVIGVLFTVFIVLLVTDVLGLTKVFPFTRSVR